MNLTTESFDKIISLESLISAHKCAFRGNRGNNYATNFDYNLVSNITNLHNQLLTNTYKQYTYRKKTIAEPKIRLIEAPSYRDRVVHHAIHQELSPFYEKCFIPGSFACRKKRGIHKAVKYVQKYLRSSERDLYVCQIDISKYYASINHGRLLELLGSKIDDPRLINLLKIIIESTDSGTEHDHLFAADSFYFTKGRRGIPIGNLTSQLFANIYLHQADMYAKQTLKIRCYVRYMDDILFFHHDKKQLHIWKKLMTDFLYNDLYLTVNPRKVRIYPASKGVSFIGYVINKDYILLRSSGVKRFKKRYCKQLVDVSTRKIETETMLLSFQSWCAHASHASAERLVNKLQSMQQEYIDKRPMIQLQLFDDDEI